MELDELLVAVEQRFRDVVDDLDSIPTAYQNAPTQTIDVDGPPDDTGPGLWRSVSWVTGESMELVRHREYTPVRMYVVVRSRPHVGIGPAISQAQSIRTTMRDSMITSPIAGAHFEGNGYDIVGKDGDGNFQVNYWLRLEIEEAVT